MRRTAMEKLVAWKSSDERKPMVLKGARQVGKTWLMKEFGKNYYKSFVYFNFDEEDELKSIFETNKNPQRIIELLSMIAGEKIHPLDTLVIFDEVQECPEALNALKYFKEKANEYHVIGFQKSIMKDFLYLLFLMDTLIISEQGCICYPQELLKSQRKNI